MGTSLKTQKTMKGVGVLACAGAGVASFVFIGGVFGILLGLVCLGLAGYNFFKMMKFMAGNGQRF